MKGKSNLVMYAILGVAIITGLFLSFGTPPNLNNDAQAPYDINQTYTLVTGTQSLSGEKGQLQMNAANLVSQVPTQPPTVTQAPPTGSVPFSSGYLDWEDVLTVINYGGNTLDSKCQGELQQAAIVEYGTTDENSPPTGNSRVGLCLNSPDCLAYGYDHYPGTLPTYTPSSECQQAISQQYYTAKQKLLSSNLGNNQLEVSIVEQADYDLNPPIAPNCDLSEGYRTVNLATGKTKYITWICDKVYSQPNF